MKKRLAAIVAALAVAIAVITLTGCDTVGRVVPALSPAATPAPATIAPKWSIQKDANGKVVLVPIEGNDKQLGPISASTGAPTSVPAAPSPVAAVITPTPTKTTPPAQEWGLALPSGIVNASNVAPGFSGDYSSVVMNKGSDPIHVSVFYSIPNSTRPGYTNLGETARSWVTITPENITLVGGYVDTVKITLSVPADAVLPSDKMEFWIGYGQTIGGVSQVLNQRWLLAAKGVN